MNGALMGNKYVTSVCGLKKILLPEIRLSGVFMVVTYVTPVTVLIKIQPDATVCRYLFTAKLHCMFRVSQHPSSGVLKTVTAASGTGTDAATSLQCGLIGTHAE